MTKRSTKRYWVKRLDMIAVESKQAKELPKRVLRTYYRLVEPVSMELSSPKGSEHGQNQK